MNVLVISFFFFANYNTFRTCNGFQLRSSRCCLMVPTSQKNEFGTFSGSVTAIFAAAGDSRQH